MRVRTLRYHCYVDWYHKIELRFLLYANFVSVDRFVKIRSQKTYTHAGTCTIFARIQKLERKGLLIYKFFSCSASNTN